jgi:hypothetical protein
MGKDPRSLYLALSFPLIFPMGRAPYKLNYLYRKFPAEYFFGENCKKELIRDWHIHFDNYRNYIPGYCAGLSFGDVSNLEAITQGINLEEFQIIEALVTDLERLYKLAVEFGYETLPEGYISKCHLCIDLRKHLVESTDKFIELKPKEFYYHL